MSSNLGELSLNLKADLTQLQLGLLQAEAEANRSATLINRSFQKSLKVKVNDSELTKLNEHLELKRRHLSDTIAHFNSNPIRPRVDLDDLRVGLVQAESEINSSDRIIQKLGRRSIKPSVDDSALTKLNQHLALKQQHLAETVAYFGSNKIRPEIDLRELPNKNVQDKNIIGESLPSRTTQASTSTSAQHTNALDESTAQTRKLIKSNQVLADALNSSFKNLAAIAHSNQGSRFNANGNSLLGLLSTITAPLRGVLTGLFEGVGHTLAQLATLPFVKQLERRLNFSITARSRQAAESIGNYLDPPKPKTYKDYATVTKPFSYGSVPSTVTPNRPPIHVNTPHPPNTATTTTARAPKQNQQRARQPSQDFLAVTPLLSGVPTTPEAYRKFVKNRKSEIQKKINEISNLAEPAKQKALLSLLAELQKEKQQIELEIKQGGKVISQAKGPALAKTIRGILAAYKNLGKTSLAATEGQIQSQLRQKYKPNPAQSQSNNLNNPNLKGPSFNAFLPLPLLAATGGLPGGQGFFAAMQGLLGGTMTSPLLPAALTLGVGGQR